MSRLRRWGDGSESIFLVLEYSKQKKHKVPQGCSPALLEKSLARQTPAHGRVAYQPIVARPQLCPWKHIAGAGQHAASSRFTDIRSISSHARSALRGFGRS